MPPFPSLRRKADFDAISRSGTTRSSALLVLRVARTGRAETRVGMSTPKSLGGAVQRNRMRRRLRAVVREQLASIGTGWDLLLIARPAAATAGHGELRDTLQALVERAGIGE